VPRALGLPRHRYRLRDAHVAASRPRGPVALRTPPPGRRTIRAADRRLWHGPCCDGSGRRDERRQTRRILPFRRQPHAPARCLHRPERRATRRWPRERPCTQGSNQRVSATETARARPAGGLGPANVVRVIPTAAPGLTCRSGFLPVTGPGLTFTANRAQGLFRRSRRTRPPLDLVHLVTWALCP